MRHGHPLSRLPFRIAVDTSPLRESRDYRLLTAGGLVTGLGTQPGLVALPYQVYVITRSPALTPWRSSASRRATASERSSA